MMNKINWKILLTTTIICLLPMVLGAMFYESVPDRVAIHFDLNNVPDNYTSKNFALFIFPALMALVQVFVCIVVDLASFHAGGKQKIERVCKAIIPMLAVVVYLMLLFYALGRDIDIGKIVCFVVGLVFMLIGNYLPKIKAGSGLSVHPHFLVTNEKVWRKVSRVAGYSFVFFGLVIMVSMFLSPIITAIALALAVIVALAQLPYSLYLLKKYPEED